MRPCRGDGSNRGRFGLLILFALCAAFPVRLGAADENLGGRSAPVPEVVAVDIPRRPVAEFHSSSRRASASDRGSSASAWWPAAAGLSILIAAAGGVGYLTTRYKPESGGFSIQVVGRASLSPKHATALLRVGDRILLVGTGPQGAPTLLCEFDPTDFDRGAPPVSRPGGST